MSLFLAKEKISRIEMILRFEVSNFRSFDDPVSWQLTPGLERQHRERLPWHKALEQAILPVALVYGANASGKTNLFQAIGFLKSYVSVGTAPKQILTRFPFKLRKHALEEPTRFSIDFVALDDQVYRYSVETTETEVHFEELVHIRESTEERIFLRGRGSQGFDLSGLEKLASKSTSIKARDRRQLFRFVAEATRPNQPFLHEALERNLHELDPVLDWFSICLQVVGPIDRPMNLEELVGDDEQIREYLRSFVRIADLGIEDIEAEVLPFEEISDLSEHAKQEIRATMSENTMKLLRHERNRAVKYFVRYRDGDLKATRLIARHQAGPGKSVPFEMTDESDGTVRFLDLALAFYALELPQSRNVFVIDELDRSLHPLLCRSLIERFLSRCGPESRCQLLMTTHDATLMTQEIFRRDEIFLMEKGPAGASSLHSLGDFKDLRNDKELRRNYLQGRFGGVPVVASV